MLTIDLSWPPSVGRRTVYAAASNRIREIRLSGIIGGLWEPSAKEELGTHSTRAKAVVVVTLFLRCYAPSFYPDSLRDIHSATRNR
jgi:hypothetical protein